MSQSLLAVSLFFHFLATVVWIGGIITLAVLVWPEARRVLQEHPPLYAFLSRLRRRFFPVSNFALVVLIVTGLSQMTADPNYTGVLELDNEWSRVMLLKHLAIAGMAISGLILQYGVIPALETATLLAERGKGDPAVYARLRRREVRLTWINVVLGIAVLGFSAWAGSL
ncbi:MAG: CopD family protein [Anaerolinea sp.]|nr:CopD family protein [Anaerolinea sp.]